MFANALKKDYPMVSVSPYNWLKWRREWDSNPRTAINSHTISSRAPSTSSAISPYLCIEFFAQQRLTTMLDYCIIAFITVSRLLNCYLFLFFAQFAYSLQSIYPCCPA